MGNKEKLDKRDGKCSRGWEVIIPNEGARVSFHEKVTFNQTPEGGEEVDWVNISEESWQSVGEAKDGRLRGQSEAKLRYVLCVSRGV